MGLRVAIADRWKATIAGFWVVAEHRSSGRRTRRRRFLGQRDSPVRRSRKDAGDVVTGTSSLESARCRLLHAQRFGIGR